MTKQSVVEFYEVVRLRDAALLFLDAHIERLLNSATIAGYRTELSAMQIADTISAYIEANGVREQNLRIVLRVLPTVTLSVNYIPSVYPSLDTYQRGVSTRMVKFSRHNPNVKQMSHALSDLRQQLAVDDDFDYLLVNADNCICEGSKTNVFFIVGDALITAPVRDVLPGVTRQAVIDSVKASVSCVERALHVSEISALNAAFFTGTSIDVLPINRIADKALATVDHALYNVIVQHYKQFVNRYVEAHTLQVGR